MHIKNKIAPWLNEDKSMKSLEVLKTESQNWSFEIWEEYLRTIEIIGKEQTQSNQYIDRTALDSFVQYIADTPQSRQRPLLRKAVKEAIGSLTTKEFQVFQLLYKYNYSPIQAAKELSVQRGSITNYRDRIFKKVKNAVLDKQIMIPYGALKTHYNNNLRETN